MSEQDVREQTAFEEMVESVANDLGGIVEQVMTDDYGQSIRDMEVTVIDVREGEGNRRGFTLDLNYELQPEAEEESEESED